ncbi:MAG: AbrB/MazE/SpoVT family DNA-binding domain-containing protein [Acidobacteriia bacterium]|nr:AbrB/MazE/SpoVT family DNA-binding domain-containing protein [Terriglobia bacterium]
MRDFTVVVDGSGRILLPAKVRKQLNLRRGSELIGRVGDDRVTFKSRAQALKEAQEHFSRQRPSGKLWSEELIQERRREARRARTV